MGEIWINDIVELTDEGECVRAVLLSGNERIVLHGARKTLVKFMRYGAGVLADRDGAEVRWLPPVHR